MRVGSYSVLIPEGVERETGHVGLSHGKQYTLRLGNHDGRQCDAEVTVDGKVIETFRLYPHQTMTLERSPDDNGRFTFYSSGTGDAAQAGEFAIAETDKGLIQVRFVPEKRRVERPKTVRPMGLCSFSSGTTRGFGGEEKTSGGITGLSGHSDQKFQTVGAIDREESESVLISIRLVTWNDGPRPLRVVERGNAVPVPV